MLRSMNAVDAKDRQAFAELQQRVIEHTTKLKHVRPAGCCRCCAPPSVP